MKRTMKYAPLILGLVLQIGLCAFAGAAELPADRELVFEKGPVAIYRVPMDSPAAQALLPGGDVPQAAAPAKPPSVTLNCLPVNLQNFVVYDAPLNKVLQHKVIVLVSVNGSYKATWKIYTDPSKPPYQKTGTYSITDAPGIYEFVLKKAPTVKGMYGFMGTVFKVGLKLDNKIHTDACKYVAPQMP